MILLPVIRDRTRKPPLGTPLKKTGPLVHGLTHAFAFNEKAGNKAFNAVDGLSYLGGSYPLSPTAWAASVYTPTWSTDYCPLGFDGSYYGFLKLTGLTNDFTVALFLDPARTQNHGILLYDSSGANVINFLSQDTASYIAIYGAVATQYPSTGVASNTIKKIILSLTGTTFTMYADDKITTSTLTLPYSIGTINIGSFNPRVYFDSIAVYNRGLSVHEMKALAANPWQIYEPETIWLPFSSSGSPGAITGGSNTALSTVTNEASGTILINGNGSATLQSLSQTGQGTVAVQGTASQTLAAIQNTAAGTISITAASNTQLGLATQSAIGIVGTPPIIGQSNTTLVETTLSGVGTILITGTGAASLQSLSSIGQGSLAVQGAAAQTLAALTQNARGINGDGPVLVAGDIWILPPEQRIVSMPTEERLARPWRV